MRKTVLAAIGAVCLTAGSAAAEQWNLPSGYNESNYHTQNLYWFADQVRTATGGQIDIVVHPAASLVKLPEIKRAVQSGQVPIGEILLANYGNEDALFEADMVPFLAVGLEEARALYEAQKPMLEKRFAAQNLVMLYSAPWPGNGLFSRPELTKMSDMKGMKFRAYNAITARVAERFGAQPVTIQVPELAQAFLTGLAQVMLTSAPIVVNTKGWDYGKYFYDIRAFHPRSAVIVNKRQWDALPEETRTEIETVAKEAEDRGWKLAAENQESSLQTLADHGIVVVEPTAEMMEEFREASGPIIDEWEQRAGPDGTALRKAIGR